MIIQDFEERIEGFEEYLSQKLEEISTLKSDGAVLFRKILYVSFLDSLSACIYPNSSNKSRFLSLVDRFSHWKDRDRVCMLHVARFCSLNSEPDLQKIREKANETLREWQLDQDGTGVIEASCNPKFDEVRCLWEKSNKESGLPYQLADFKLINLLYQLRNSLVHQFQSQGAELGPLLPKEPSYQLFKTVSAEEELVPSHFELVYPSSFLHDLCKTVFSNVIEYLKEGNINPFPNYYAGDFWLKELNK